MSLMQLTEYLLWKSIRNKTAPNIAEPVNIKQEFINKQEIFDYDMICRVCMNPAEVPITDKIEDTLIISAIRTVANISITEADCYPKYVCKMCLDELKIAFKFKKKCEASDMVFRKTISCETVLVTNSQPMVMHDFSLILHQMKEKRLTQSVSIKNDENDHDDFNNEQMPRPSPFQHIHENPTTEINLLQPIKRRKSTASMTDTSAHNRVINIINYSSVCDNTDNGILDISSTANVDKYKTKTKGKKALRVHKCKRCDLKFDTKEEFQKHRKDNSCIYNACPLCGKLVLNLANHERIVHSRTHKYTCHQCGKIYYSSGALTNHMHKHRETKEFFCEHCPYRGKRKSYLVCHMRVHTGEHRYLCSMCPLKFTNPSNLTKHQLVHFNKKFECSKCKRLFRQEKHLNEHFDAAHLNIRYRCTICSRDLSSRKKLLSHELRVHKREKHKLFEEVQRVVIGNHD